MIYLRFDEIDSTNTYLKNNYQSLNDWTIVQANFQSAGRGRLERKFLIEKGKGLIESILLKDEFAFENTELISILVGVALSKTLEEYNVNSLIKWPNDILVNGKKISGILLEGVSTSKMEALIVGIGMNLNQDRFSEELTNAISLKMVLNEDISIEEFSYKFNDKLFNLYESFKNGNDIEFLNHASKNLAYKNEIVFALVNGTKKLVRILKILENGHLLIEDNGETRELRSGEISFHSDYARNEKRLKHKNIFKTGEDIDMLHENFRENKNSSKEEINICDKNIDGA